MRSVRALPSSWLANHVVDVINARGESHSFVLRRWARPGWEADDPEFTAAQEATVLGLLADSDVAVPGVIAADPDAASCDVPALLLTVLPGQPPPDRPSDLGGFLAQLASALPMIHAVDPRGVVHEYSRYYESDRLSAPSWSSRPDVWARALDIAAQPPPPGPAVLVHRDYHPGNTLWSGRHMTGIVDWTAASTGPSGVDVGHMRWNLAANHSLEAADDFLARYRAVVGGQTAEHQAYWDVVTAVDVLPELDVGAQPDDGLLRLEEHVAAAVKRAS